MKIPPVQERYTFSDTFSYFSNIFIFQRKQSVLKNISYLLFFAILGAFLLVALVSCGECDHTYGSPTVKPRKPKRANVTVNANAPSAVKRKRRRFRNFRIRIPTLPRGRMTVPIIGTCQPVNMRRKSRIRRSIPTKTAFARFVVRSCRRSHGGWHMRFLRT